jgi:hypothetical protein
LQAAKGPLRRSFPQQFLYFCRCRKARIVAADMRFRTKMPL